VKLAGGEASLCEREPPDNHPAFRTPKGWVQNAWPLFEAVRSTARKGETAGEIVEEKAESADNRAPKASGVQSTLLIERQHFTTH